jgi:hypothetical protein
VPQWLEAEGQGLSDSEVPVLGSKLAPLQVVYPIGTCLVPPPAEGLVGVIVGANGQLVKEPVLLDSTGYTVLDEKALELPRAYLRPPDRPFAQPYATGCRCRYSMTALTAPLNEIFSLPPLGRGAPAQRLS